MRNLAIFVINTIIHKEVVQDNFDNRNRIKYDLHCLHCLHLQLFTQLVKDTHRESTF